MDFLSLISPKRRAGRGGRPRLHRHVAGPAALLVAKLGERQATSGRLVDRDAHDLFRLLVATRTNVLAATLRTLCDAEEGVGDPASLAASVAVLARDLLDAIGSRQG